jgi:hypothetical protein
VFEQPVKGVCVANTAGHSNHVYIFKKCVFQLIAPEYFELVMIA